MSTSNKLGLVVSSAGELRRLLNEHCYIAKPEVAKVMYLALRLGKPLLLEGPPGGGKTQVAKVLSDALLDITGMEIGCREVEVDSAFEAKLRGTVREMGGRDMIAEAVARPIQLTGRRRDVEFGCDDLLVAVVAWTQHHPVLPESDRLSVMVGGQVLDGENRHCGP